MNWHEFFKRLTIVTSILIIPITTIICVETNIYLWSVNIGSNILIAILNGISIAIVVWILYFSIRWIVHGLKKIKEK